MNISGLSIGGDNKIENKRLDIELIEEEKESIKDFYQSISDRIPILNYKNIYLSEEENKKIFDDYIVSFS
ncbi:hypothetical protein [Candidatus Nanopusillus massiliensis]|uniref:hypothetical protein n=1 Tax=Candidatus Nanopusillus massiliensis TaxID=2897163 RepID=UPI001E5977BC|nr:hypothetical protein [Candidatus Nanopusillus massiliensis]